MIISAVQLILTNDFSTSPAAIYERLRTSSKGRYGSWAECTGYACEGPTPALTTTSPLTLPCIDMSVDPQRQRRRRNFYVISYPLKPTSLLIWLLLMRYRERVQMGWDREA